MVRRPSFNVETSSRRAGAIPGALAAAVLALGAAAPELAAQTDYYNTDAGRPVRIEDAYPVERYAFEAQVAPLRLERADAGVYHWEIEPELAYGIFPRTQLEVGLPLVFQDAGEGRDGFGLAGIDVSVLHNLNVETRTLPALAVAAEVLLPVGSFAPDRVYPSVKGIATRTFGFARVHANAQYTFGSSPAEGLEAGEASRWMAGLAVDRALPLRSTLLIADLFAEQPLHEGDDLRWTAEAGARYQISPFFALDAGIGRRLTGDEQGWFVTFGAARMFAVRGLIPVPGR
ncbi:MAG TPA: transporter [Longimicrobiaceae bacterium]|nr:transporter [Longimicrobiaceae bacterium]